MQKSRCSPAENYHAKQWVSVDGSFVRERLSALEPDQVVAVLRSAAGRRATMIKLATDHVYEDAALRG
ncbi:MAG: hypothetical protein M3343_08300 [Actinomycetota bacterium]|nr:hypothetical protein [Actinomycetota bacterium]